MSTTASARSTGKFLGLVQRCETNNTNYHWLRPSLSNNHRPQIISIFNSSLGTIRPFTITRHNQPAKRKLGPHKSLSAGCPPREHLAKNHSEFNSSQYSIHLSALSACSQSLGTISQPRENLVLKNHSRQDAHQENTWQNSLGVRLISISNSHLGTLSFCLPYRFTPMESNETVSALLAFTGNKSYPR
jgi:hypothetical protein